MKRVYLMVAIFCLAAVVLLGWLVTSRQSMASKSTDVSVGISQKPVHPNYAPVASNFPKPAEWNEFHSAREKALEADPSLAAEYKQILAEMNQQQKDLEAAMIKSDPKVAPAVHRLDALREHNSISTVTAPNVGGVNAQPLPTLSSADWQEVRFARQAALRANPPLVTNSERLATQLRDFRMKMNSAMVQADPRVASVIEEFHGNRAPSDPTSKTAK